VKITVHGTLPTLGEEFEAIIDTGFTGFLMMPILSAFPLGLILYGTSNYTLADGSTSTNLLALGKVKVAGEEEAVSGVIVLGTDCDLLLGMDYLRLSKRSLVVSDKGVMLVGEEVVDRVIVAFQQSRKS
jgi:predicted aspartyl protease